MYIVGFDRYVQQGTDSLIEEKGYSLPSIPIGPSFSSVATSNPSIISPIVNEIDQ